MHAVGGGEGGGSGEGGLGGGSGEGGKLYSKLGVPFPKVAEV